MGKVLAVGNLKGGTGKTAIAINLACQMAKAGRRVALVDADRQATATAWCGAGALPVTLERLPLDTDAGAARWISKVTALSGAHDFVVIDLPPHIGTVTAAALVLADILLVPVTPSPADLLATSEALDLLREARQHRGGSAPRCLLVPAKVDLRTAPGREIVDALRGFHEPVAPIIGQRSAYVQSFGSWVGELAPGGKAHEEVMRLDVAVRKALR